MIRRLTIVAAMVALLALAPAVPPAQGDAESRYITGKIKLIAYESEPKIRMRAHWAWFPLEEYPFDEIGDQDPERPQINPDLLAAYVNFGCHFEGFVDWEYEELESELLDNDRVRKRLKLTRGDQGGFYNNELKFKCELATKSRQLNRRLGVLLTTGQAPSTGMHMGLVQVVWMRMIKAINTAPRNEGSWGHYLYETFKSIMTFDLMDDNEGEADLYFSPDGERLEYEISRQRTVVLEF